MYSVLSHKMSQWGKQNALVALAAVLVLTGGGAWLAFDSWAARAPATPDMADPLALEEQLELLSHKIVVLSARQSDEKELRQELAKLKEQMERMQESLESQPWWGQEAEVGPGPEAARHKELEVFAAVYEH